MKKVIVGAYWGAREEARKACAQRLAVFFKLLREREPLLDQWIRNDKAMSTDAASLVDCLSADVQGTGDQVRFPELGFIFSARNELENPGRARVTGSLGGFSARGSNTFVITTRDGEHSLQALQSMLHAAVEAFDPDDAIVNGTETLAAAYQQMDAAEARGEKPSIWDPPAWYRYKRGVGFSGDGPKPTH